MKKFTVKTSIPLPMQDVIAGFTKDLFIFITPPFLEIEIDRYDGHKLGDRIEFKISTLGLMQSWISEIVESDRSEREYFFVDEGLELPEPFTFWRHTHRIIKVDELNSEIIDDIQFKCQNIPSELIALPLLKGSFLYRRPLYKRFYKLYF